MSLGSQVAASLTPPFIDAASIVLLSCFTSKTNLQCIPHAMVLFQGLDSQLVYIH